MAIPERERPPERTLRSIPLRSFLVDLVLPPLCALCTEPVESSHFAVCCACEQSFTPTVLPSSTGLDRRVALLRHDGRVRRAVHGVKYRGEAWRGRPLGRAMAAALPLLLEGPPREGWVLVPSPLSPARLRTRGYNQSALLARGVSQCTGLPIAWRMLDRIRDDGPQAGRSRRERARIRGSFRAHAAEGAQVVLLDDVTTTGETLMACAEALRAGGARTVCALCLAWADGTQPSS